MNEQQAFKLLREKTGYDKVDRCMKTKDEYLFFVNTGEGEATDDSNGLFRVDINTGNVEPYNMMVFEEKMLNSEDPYATEEIDPEIFEANKLFNL